MSNVHKDILTRIYVSFFIVFLMALAVVVQGFRIQFVEGSHWKSLADSLSTSFVTIPAERGNIFSEDGRLIATSLPYFEVRFDPLANGLDEKIYFDKVDSLSRALSGFFKDRTP